MQLTVRRVRMNKMRRFGDGINIGMSVPNLKDLKPIMRIAVDKSRKETAEWTAKEIFKRSQKNIKQMNAIDRSILLDSGYVEPMSEHEGGWWVGYRAPYAWYVDRGTRNYSSPPPFENIYEWVKRNIYIATKSTTEPTMLLGEEAKKEQQRKQPKRNDMVSHSVDYNYQYKKYKRFKTTTAGGKRQRDYRYPAHVEYRYDKVKYAAHDDRGLKKFIKPQKKDFVVGRSGDKMERLDFEKYKDDAEIRRIARRIQWHIFKHGTAPKPFWSNAVADVQNIATQAFNERINSEIKTTITQMLRQSLRSAGRVFGGHLRRVPRW